MKKVLLWVFAPFYLLYLLFKTIKKIDFANHPMIMHSLGKYDKALRGYKDLIMKNPDQALNNAYYYFNMALIYRETGINTESEKYFAKAAEGGCKLNPDDYPGNKTAMPPLPKSK